MHKIGAAFLAVVFGTLGVIYVVSDPGAETGALVRTSMDSTVGVVLDEIPTSMRARVAASLAAEPESFWTKRAARQVQLASYRLVFRGAFYEEAKSSLPLPPESVWSIKLTGKPARKTIGGHDIVAVNYRFSSVLLSDMASPRASEPALAKPGGTWDEPFEFPIDPELVLQRTGYACMDESEFPFPSVDSEEVDSFYDHECEAEDGLSPIGQCHATRDDGQSCVDALAEHVGSVKTSMRYRRIAWNSGTADAVRVGTVTGDAPDLQVHEGQFAPSRVVYRYVRASGCEAAEGAVAGTGWRRLVQFTTADENVGNRPLRIGAVDYANEGEPQELDAHKLFEFSACHQHYHFKYYGDFRWEGGGRLVNAKNGFCLQSTSRSANREHSPLSNAFAGCAYQGIEAGWVDEYKAGIPAQWLDTTGLPAGVGTRTFTSNPHGLLCEGTLLDSGGNPLQDDAPIAWTATKLKADDGSPVEAPRCRPSARWNANNKHSVQQMIPPFGQGMLTMPCGRGQIGPLRNCGFATTPVMGTCVPGRSTTIRLTIPRGAQPQVARLTDYSHALRSPIPARFEDSWIPMEPGVSDQPSMLANVIVDDGGATVRFRCPSARDAAEPGGRFSIYSAPVYPRDRTAAVTLQK